MIKSNPDNLTAEKFIKRLKPYQSSAELKKYERSFPPDKRDGNEFISWQMGKVFALPNEFMQMPLNEVEKEKREYYLKNKVMVIIT